MRTAILALTAAVGLGVASVSAGAAPLAPHSAAAANGGIILVEGGCGGGWHPVPGHWVGGQWEPTRCAPNDRGGDWSAPYPAYPAYQAYESYRSYEAYPSYEAYSVPYTAYPYPPQPHWARPY
jgi:hypothetical protein